MNPHSATCYRWDRRNWLVCVCAHSRPWRIRMLPVDRRWWIWRRTGTAGNYQNVAKVNSFRDVMALLNVHDLTCMRWPVEGRPECVCTHSRPWRIRRVAASGQWWVLRYDTAERAYVVYDKTSTFADALAVLDDAPRQAVTGSVQ